MRAPYSLVVLAAQLACSSGSALPGSPSAQPSVRSNDGASVEAPSPSAQPRDDESHGRLRRAARASGSLLGVALGPRLAEPSHAALAARAFDYVTPESQMMWAPTEPHPGEFDFGAGDDVVAFAAEHRMRVKGHVLVGSQELPIWLRSLPDAASVDRAMRSHIHGLVGHWRGDVDAWDVVSEAIADGGTAMRRNVFLDKLGTGYVARAFRYAREADPDARLFYVDHGIEQPGPRANAIYALVKGLVDEGMPIDGVGFRISVPAGATYDAKPLEAAMQRYAALGLTVNLSELEGVPSPAYCAIAALCIGHPRCRSITVWGADDNAWLEAVGDTACE
jgi:endo-1,4-beta-xylanase